MVLRAVVLRHGLGESGSRYLLANLQEDMLMTKADLVEKIAAKANLTKAAAERALNAFLASVEDSLSKEAKLTLTGQYGLSGVGYWNLMRPFPQNWVILNALYHIREGL